MKKVVLLLPDKVIHMFGTSRSHREMEVDLTKETLMKVLSEEVDYHERYKFSKEDIQIVSLRTVKKQKSENNP